MARMLYWYVAEAGFTTCQVNPKFIIIQHISSMKKGYKKDFQSWKGIVTLKLLCCNIAAGRFDWKKYCTPQPQCGQEMCVIPLHCSYGQIGYTVYFPYSDMPEVEYDWEMNKLTIDKENWENYLQN